MGKGKGYRMSSMRSEEDVDEEAQEGRKSEIKSEFASPGRHSIKNNNRKRWNEEGPPE